MHSCMTAGPFPLLTVLLPRTGSEGRPHASYTVKMCGNVDCCRTLWNRDVNAAINMLHIFVRWCKGLDRPLALQRGTDPSGPVLDRELLDFPD